MDEKPESSSTAHSDDSLVATEVVHQAKKGEHDGTQSVADECSHRKNCLYAALRDISLDMLVNPVPGNFGRHLTPETRAIVINVKQFFVMLKEYLGPDTRGTILSSTTAMTATACSVSDATVDRAWSKAKRRRPGSSMGPPRW